MKVTGEKKGEKKGEKNNDRKNDRKITVHVPSELLERAREQSGQGITETVRRGLRLVAAGGTYTRLRQLRGRRPLSVDLDELRRDRR